MLKKLFFFLFLLCTSLKSHAFPELSGQVVDQAQVLSHYTQTQLNSLLQSEKKHQVVVVTLSDLKSLSIEEYGYQLARHWGIGEKENNNGVLFIIAPNEKQVRIEVGYGLEGALTDTLAATILNDLSVLLENKDFDQAAIVGTKKILSAIAGETFSEKNTKKQTSTTAIVLACLVLALFIYVAFAPKNNRASKLRLFLTLISFVPSKGVKGFKGKGGNFGGGGASKRIHFKK